MNEWKNPTPLQAAMMRSMEKLFDDLRVEMMRRIRIGSYDVNDATELTSWLGQLVSHCIENSNIIRGV